MKMNTQFLKILITLSILYQTTLAATQGLVIIVHGTWAVDTTWCKPGGDFFDTVARHAHYFDKATVPFTWSGHLSHDARVQASKTLEALIVSYPVETPITIIAHSHGGNAVLLATQALGKRRAEGQKTPYIDTLYLLGTPIKTELYAPDMSIVKKIYSFYSLGDIIQPVFGTYDRVFPPHDRIANISITIDEEELSHSELHDPQIGEWILRIHEWFASKKEGNFDNFSFKEAGHINFVSTNAPDYRIKSEEDALFEFKRDEMMHNRLFVKCMTTQAQSLNYEQEA